LIAGGILACCGHSTARVWTALIDENSNSASERRRAPGSCATVGRSRSDDEARRWPSSQPVETSVHWGNLGASRPSSEHGPGSVVCERWLSTMLRQNKDSSSLRE
jgi:hypothetical protein